MINKKPINLKNFTILEQIIIITPLVIMILIGGILFGLLGNIIGGAIGGGIAGLIMSLLNKKKQR